VLLHINIIRNRRITFHVFQLCRKSNLLFSVAVGDQPRFCCARRKILNAHGLGIGLDLHAVHAHQYLARLHHISFLHQDVFNRSTRENNV